MPTTLTARTLLTADGPLDYPIITHDTGRILTIESGAPSNATGTLTPAFFDIHVHGAIAHDFMTAGAAEIDTVGRFLATHGVAHYLPTTVTGPVGATLRALENLADAIEAAQGPTALVGAALPVGIHLEGPFVAHGKRGVHPAASLLPPSIPLFDRFQQAARGHIRLITLAPELPGALDLIAHAARSGVRVSLGHTDATAPETIAAIAAGAVSGTHTFNAMRPLHHREPGILGTLLDCDDLYAEAICDGIHVHPALIRMWLKMKGEARAILVTDGMAATGMPNGTYTLGDFPVEVTDGVCLSDGALAGSTLTMDRAVANLQHFTGSPLATAVTLASRNPARMLGLPELTSLTPGSPANFNLYNEADELQATILRGRSLPRS